MWSAELFEPTDGLPLIGKVAGKENVWMATGLSGVGLTLGTAAATLIADGIEQRPDTSLTEKLSPTRYGLSKISQMIGEQATALGNYTERILPASSVEPADLLPGEGAVGKRNGAFVAACRDQAGCLHQVSPLCTHMGGVVHWNEAAQTWDCPVHGGRFSPNGERLYGPPSENLGDRENS
jgi:Rieske Fe-S protein